MVVHPAAGNWSGTFVNALLYHCQNLEKGGTLRPGIVHRLDKDTSGVLVAAKTNWMQQRMVELFASRQVYKEYLAICIGNPGTGEIETPIGRHPVHRKQMAVTTSGKRAHTLYRTLSWNGKLSVVQVIITTGRTHQIRVHLKHRGTPVLGDPLYGNSQANKLAKVTYQLLHASTLRFKHPVTGHDLTLTAPPPPEMALFIEKIA